jgi:hypothetical protein
MITEFIEQLIALITLLLSLAWFTASIYGVWLVGKKGYLPRLTPASGCVLLLFSGFIISIIFTVGPFWILIASKLRPKTKRRFQSIYTHPLYNPDAHKTWTSTSTYNTPTGGVYLLRSGRYYKIGKATIFDKRIKRIALQLPEPIEVIHKIYSNNPDELERRWHQRFASKRRNGEWFELTDVDVAEFRSQSRM